MYLRDPNREDPIKVLHLYLVHTLIYLETHPSAHNQALLTLLLCLTITGNDQCDRPQDALRSDTAIVFVFDNHSHKYLT